MKMRNYQTRRGLWCVASAAVFIAIGLLVRFDVKGVNESLMRLIAEDIGFLFSGREGLGAVPFLALWLGTWIMVAALVGWLLQSVVVITLYPRNENSEAGN